MFALVLSGAGARLHVFIEAESLPRAIAFGVLCLPAVMLGLALHLVLLMRLEAQVQSEPSTPTERVGASIEVTERVLERTGGGSVTRGTTTRGPGKTGQFIAALDQLPPGDARKAERERAAGYSFGLGTPGQLAYPLATRLVTWFGLLELCALCGAAVGGDQVAQWCTSAGSIPCRAERLRVDARPRQAALDEQAGALQPLADPGCLLAGRPRVGRHVEHRVTNSFMLYPLRAAAARTRSTSSSDARHVT